MQGKFQVCVVFVLASLIGIIGCSNNKGDDDKDSNGNGTKDTDVPNLDSNPTLDDIDTAEVCATIEQGISDMTVKVMLLQDISSSMNESIGNGGTKWEVAREALTGMVSRYNDDVDFGLDFFPLNGECTVGSSVAIDAAPNNASAVAARLAATELSRSTPLYLGMSNFLNASYSPSFLAEGSDSYLVIVSDGMDSCGTNGQMGGSVTDNQLTEVTSSLLRERGIRTFVIGFGSGIDAGQLNAIARAGGTRFNEFFNAENEEELNEALESIGSTVVVSCRYQLGDVPETADVNLTNIYFDTKGLLRGNDCSGDANWIWGNDEKTVIEFCPQACNMLESGQVQELQIVVMCTEDEVIIIPQ